MTEDPTTTQLRAATPADAPRLAEIYNHYVRETVVTFEEEPIGDAEMARRVEEIGARWMWRVAECGGTLVGFTYASPWKARSAYRYTAECTVYLAHDALGRGTGRLLYDHLLGGLRTLGLHVAIGTIALPNAASVALHEACGFRKIAHHSEVGRKLGRWVDIGCWEKRL